MNNFYEQPSEESKDIKGFDQWSIKIEHMLDKVGHLEALQRDVYIQTRLGEWGAPSDRATIQVQPTALKMIRMTLL